MVGWLEFNVPFQHKYGYIRDELGLMSGLAQECVKTDHCGYTKPSRVLSSGMMRLALSLCLFLDKPMNSMAAKQSLSPSSIIWYRLMTVDDQRLGR